MSANFSASLFLQIGVWSVAIIDVLFTIPWIILIFYGVVIWLVTSGNMPYLDNFQIFSILYISTLISIAHIFTGPAVLLCHQKAYNVWVNYGIWGWFTVAAITLTVHIIVFVRNNSEIIWVPNEIRNGGFSYMNIYLVVFIVYKILAVFIFVSYKNILFSQEKGNEPEYL